MKNEKGKRARGMGSIFLNGSTTWWVKYSDRGIAHRESSFSTEHKVAEELLSLRLAQLKVGTFIPPKNVRVDDLVEDLFSKYREKQQQLDTVEQRWRLHLKPFFTRRRATDVTTDMVRRYIASRVAESAAPATINRELAVLKGAYHLARKSTPAKVLIVPYIPMFQEKNTRKGFLNDGEHARLATECANFGLWLRAMLATGYNFGWRSSEVLGMRVGQIDLIEGTVRLEPGTTKNQAGRTVTMTKDVSDLIRLCVTGKKQNDYVFTRDNGKPVLDFRHAWQGSCVRAGVSGQNGVSRFVCLKCGKTMPETKTKCACGSRRRKYDGLLFHDLRRTGVRNLRRAGVAESVAMKISGHKTANVFKRYDIVEQADLREAAAALDRKSAAYSFGQSSGRTGTECTETVATTEQLLKSAVRPN